MRFKYDKVANAAYVTLRSGKVASTERVDALRLIDYDRNGVALRIEFLDFRSGVDLSGLPDAEKIERILPPRTRILAGRREALG
jgi:uncharacterized protein YuzE